MRTDSPMLGEDEAAANQEMLMMRHHATHADIGVN
jgi:hypothetical protein